MEGGSRQIIRAQTPLGEDVAIVMQLTPDRMLAWHRQGAEEPVLFDLRTITRLVNSLRFLQAKGLEGVIWPDIP